MSAQWGTAKVVEACELQCSGAGLGWLFRMPRHFFRRTTAFASPR
jgi:hypothetical protein